MWWGIQLHRPTWAVTQLPNNNPCGVPMGHPIQGLISGQDQCQHAHHELLASSRRCIREVLVSGCCSGCDMPFLLAIEVILIKPRALAEARRIGADAARRRRTNVNPIPAIDVPLSRDKGAERAIRKWRESPFTGSNEYGVEKTPYSPTPGLSLFRLPRSGSCRVLLNLIKIQAGELQMYVSGVNSM